MENELSSIITRLGAGSGINMAQLAVDLSESRFAPQRTRLEERNAVLETSIESATLLRNQLSQLASALGDRIRTGDLSPSVQLSNPAIASGSLGPGANPRATYELEVTQLASAQTLALNAFSSADDLVGDGTLTLRFGSVDGASFTENTNVAAVDIAVEATDTLATLAGKINSSGAGVTAYIANGTNGTQLVLKGDEGEQNGFVVETSGGGTAPGELGYLAWNAATDSGQLRADAGDAEFSLDTIAMTSASNQVTGLPEGLSLDLTGTNAGNPATVSFTDRTNQIPSVMADFVTALNDIAATLNQTAAAIGGELGNDPGARALRRELAGLSSEVIMPNAGPDEPATLGDLGLSLTRDGTFRFDAQRLQDTLANSPEGASAMFTTGIDGVFAKMDDLARAMAISSDPGTLAGSVARYTSELAANDDRLARIAEQQEALRSRLNLTLGAADRNIAFANSTLSFLEAQVAAFNGDN